MASDHRLGGLLVDDASTESKGLSPATVRARLAVLRTVYVPERDADARARLARERPVSTRPFALSVERRLRELRALCELARHLHSAGKQEGVPVTSSRSPMPKDETGGNLDRVRPVDRPRHAR